MENKELKEAIASIMKDSTKREALAEMIIEYVNVGHISQDIIGMILNTRSLNVGDSLLFKVRKGIKVWSWVPGAIPLKSEITVSERMNYLLDGAIVSVTANEGELKSGELGTVDSIASEMALKLRDFYVNKLFTALTTVWTAVNTPSNYATLGTAVTATALEAAINRINQTTTGVKAIIGSRVALTPIMKFTAWQDDPFGNTQQGAVSQTRMDQVLNTGWLGSYLGANLVIVNQEYDYPDSYNKMIPENKILVVGENAGDFITYGGVNRQEYTDMRPVPPQWNLSMYQNFAFNISNAQGLYLIDGLV